VRDGVPDSGALLMPLTPADVRNKQFNTTRLRPGYDEEEVDAFLEEVEAELFRLIAENEELRAKLAGPSRRGGQRPAMGLSSSLSDPRPDTGSPALPAMNSADYSPRHASSAETWVITDAALLRKAVRRVIRDSSAAQAEEVIGNIAEALLVGLRNPDSFRRFDLFDLSDLLRHLYISGSKQVRTGISTLAKDATANPEARISAAIAVARSRSRGKAIIELRKLVHSYTGSATLRQVIAVSLLELGDESTGLSILLRMAENRHVNPEDRLECALALIDLEKIDESAAALLAILRDPLHTYEDCYREAALILSEIKGLAAAKALQNLGRDADALPKARLEAALTLSELGRPAAAIKIMLALSQYPDIDPQVRMASARELARIGRTTEATNTLAELAGNPEIDDATRWQAFSQMNSFADRERCASILRILAPSFSTDYEMSREVAESMAQLGLVDDLVREIRKPKVFPNFNIVIMALAETGHGYDLQQIIGDSTLSEAVRLSAAGAVMAIRPDAPARVEIHRLATSPAVSLDTRYEAARLLSPDAADAELLSAFREIALSTDSSISRNDRLRAATDLWNSGENQDALRVFKSVAQDRSTPDYDRVSAALKLTEIGEADAYEILMDISEDPNVSSRELIKIAEFLVEQGHAAARKLLLRMATVKSLNDEYDRMRACRLIERQGWLRQVAHVVKELALTRTAIASDALGMLERLGDVQAMLEVYRHGQNPYDAYAGAAVGRMADRSPIAAQALDEAVSWRSVDNYARLRLAHSIIKINPDASTRIFIELCSDAEPGHQVHDWAVQELITLGATDRVVGVLLRQLQLPDFGNRIRSRIIDPLIELGRTRELRDCLRKQSVEVDLKIEIARALAKAGLSEGAETLLTLARDFRTPAELRRWLFR
jgi:DivIVA domain-containing protein